jgi:chromate transporter
VIKGTWARTFRVLGITFALWWTPVIFLGLSLGWDNTLTMMGLFFSKAALVTFGGAYAVLPYVAQQAVETHHWLDHTQMMSGLALAESTPGPLIMVLQFVGFLGAYQNPGNFNPWVAAAAGAVITTWVTFLPCFMFVFIGAPWIEKLGEFPRVSAALVAITASVVGVILNLGVKFSEAALWNGEKSVDWFVAIVALSGFALLHRFKVSLIPLLACSAVSGVLWRIFVA